VAGETGRQQRRQHACVVPLTTTYAVVPYRRLELRGRPGGVQAMTSAAVMLHSRPPPSFLPDKLRTSTMYVPSLEREISLFTERATHGYWIYSGAPACCLFSSLSTGRLERERAEAESNGDRRRRARGGDKQI
jgi:hypothetical protein